MANERKPSARTRALAVLDAVTGKDSFADSELEGALTGLGTLDRALATELVYGTLRNIIRLDWIIESFSSMRADKLERSVLNALRLGVYQLAFLDRVPESAAVNESVNLVKGGPHGRRRAGFVNAVLRKIASNLARVRYPDPELDPAKHISVFHSHPEWMVRRWVERFGVVDARSLCAAACATPPRMIRVNTLRLTRDSLAEELTRDGFIVKPSAYSPDGLEVLRGGRLDPLDGRYYIQDEASQLVAMLVAPEPGEMVLDACAAPGGKATHMAALMQNRGAVVALDVSNDRIKTLEAAAARLGAAIIKTKKADARVPFRPAPPAEHGFDAVLVDAPCSGLGVLRRSPDIKLRRTEADLRANSQRQAALVKNLAAVVKPGGRIVYSVCSFEPEETDDVVGAFLAAHPEFSVEDARGVLPQACSPLVDEDGFMRSYPHIHGIDGFFAVRLKRKTGA